MATVDGIIAASHRRPLQVGDLKVDEHTVPMVLFTSLTDDRDPARATLADEVRGLAQAAQGKPVHPSADFDQLLRFLLTGTASPDGMQSSSQYGSAQTAILCGDAPAERNPETYWRDIQASRAKNPEFGPITNDINACAFWQPPREPRTHVHNNTPALIVAATGDTRTIYQSSQGLHHVLTGSRLLTLNGAAVHTVYANYGNTCVDDTVNAYFDSGQLPPTDPTCQKQPIAAS
jgi:hypothetical protein